MLNNHFEAFNALHDFFQEEGWEDLRLELVAQMNEQATQKNLRNKGIYKISQEILEAFVAKHPTWSDWLAKVVKS